MPGKQYVDTLNWDVPGADPKTGGPLNYDPAKDVQGVAPGQPTASARQGPDRRDALPISNSAARTGSPAHTIRSSGLFKSRSREGCNYVYPGAEGLRRTKAGTVNGGASAFAAAAPHGRIGQRGRHPRRSSDPARSKRSAGRIPKTNGGPADRPPAKNSGVLPAMSTARFGYWTPERQGGLKRRHT